MMRATPLTRAHRSPVSFNVDEVVPAGDLLPTGRLSETVDRRFRRKMLALTDSEKPVICPECVSFSPKSCHPLIETIHTAFSQHYPLTLSPDSIWLVIAQGFSHHVNENAETLRPRLVRQKGRVVLKEYVNGIGMPHLERAIAGFSRQIRDASDPVLHDTLICDFSTTTPSVRTASEVTLMDTYSSYFQYQLRCVCGIPRINLTGTVEDWERIRARVEVFATFGLEWWVSRLRPILDEFVQTVKSSPDLRFWRAIYKPKRVYVATAVTGWIADLFPYLDDPPNRKRSHAFDSVREHWATPAENAVQARKQEKMVWLSTFPSGLSSVPCELTFSGESKTELDLVAGFFGVEQNPRDLSLAPVIGWSLAERPPSSPVPVSWRDLHVPAAEK